LLEGIRVLDAASFIAGPVATTTMADFGAGYSASAYNFPWIVDNRRNKRGIAAMVSTSLLANRLWLNAIAVQGILCGARTTVRLPREDAVDALANLEAGLDGAEIERLLSTGVVVQAKA
jgi:hypothetical protein